ncbi:MAG: hypothetical protein DHS20C08_13550 [Rhodomicrobium sp.]|nr:MAG: hypothetical protein DHS20C08_13550 [Rhodomicrobium sp.]
MSEITLHSLAYVSKATEKSDLIASDIQEILKTAKIKNPQHGITGVLFYHDGLFLQVIEGARSDLHQLLANIRGDQRHSDVRVLLDEPVKKRGFSDWNMDCFNLSDSAEIDIEQLVKIGEDFKENLVPRADIFVKFYRAILERQSA